MVFFQRRKSPLILPDFTKLSCTLTVTNSTAYTNTHAFTHKCLDTVRQSHGVTHAYSHTHFIMSMKSPGVRSRLGLQDQYPDLTRQGSNNCATVANFESSPKSYEFRHLSLNPVTFCLRTFNKLIKLSRFKMRRLPS